MRYHIGLRCHITTADRQTHHYTYPLFCNRMTITYNQSFVIVYNNNNIHPYYDDDDDTLRQHLCTINNRMSSNRQPPTRTTSAVGRSVGRLSRRTDNVHIQVFSRVQHDHQHGLTLSRFQNSSERWFTQDLETSLVSSQFHKDLLVFGSCAIYFAQYNRQHVDDVTM